MKPHSQWTWNERHRVREGELASDAASFGRCGTYVFNLPGGEKLFAVVFASGDLEESDPEAQRWDHVSVRILTRKNRLGRIPTWAEMCKAKSLFFEPEETVVQYHPRKEDYVNCHPNVLHLWRLADGEMPMPPKRCV